MNGSDCLHFTGIKSLALTEVPLQKCQERISKARFCLEKPRNELFESPEVWNLSSPLSSLCKCQQPEFLQPNIPEPLGGYSGPVSIYVLSGLFARSVGKCRLGPWRALTPRALLSSRASTSCMWTRDWKAPGVASSPSGTPARA